MLQGTRRSAPFKQAIAKPEKIGPEHNIWYWHPSRAGVRLAPSWFTGPLQAAMGDELEITWNPLLERWQVWSKAPRIQNPVCQGWRLLFVHNGPSGEYLPLDERIHARLWSCSADNHGNGRAYFQRIADEYRREEERKEERLRQEAIDRAMPFWDHSQIKVAMRGKSSGSKFSTYHA